MEEPILKVSDLMTKNVLTIQATDSLETVAQLFEKYDYDGMPVVGAGNKLLGIISAYDMVVQSSGMHLPTVLNIMAQISADKADRKDLDEHFQKLREITAKQIMNTNPLTIKPDTSLQDAAKIFAEHHRVNPIIIVNEDGTLAGVLSRYDIIRIFNQNYLKQALQTVTTYSDPFKEFSKTNSEQAVESSVGDLSREFLFVTKKRPLIWRFVAIAAFIAGLMGATALIIRIVQKGG